MFKSLLSVLFLLAMCCYGHAQHTVLWGTTVQGGRFDEGVLFGFDAATSTMDRAVNFNADSLGAEPFCDLISDPNGNFYGSAFYGGAAGIGQLFKFVPATGADVPLHNFSNSDGAGPVGGLLLPGGNTLYGVTRSGGTYNAGTLFSYNIDNGNFTTLYQFGFGADGVMPTGTLIQASNGLLYGMTNGGGVRSLGTIFSYDLSSNTFNTCYNFAGTVYSDGQGPSGSLLQAGNGLLYGITGIGGPLNMGTLFSYNIATATEKVLHNFDTVGGSNPVGTLIQASDNLLYGLTTSGGTFGGGVIFSYSPADSLYLFHHDFGTDGQDPAGSLVQAPDGLLYGTARLGGIFGQGVIFSYNINTLVVTVIHSFDITDGEKPLCKLLVTNGAVDIHPISNKAALHIYPNPGSGICTVQLPEGQRSYATEVYNTLGQQVQQLVLSPAQNTLNLTAQPTGVYFVYVHTGNATTVAKVVVER